MMPGCWNCVFLCSGASQRQVPWSSDGSVCVACACVCLVRVMNPILAGELFWLIHLLLPGRLGLVGKPKRAFCSYEYGD